MKENNRWVFATALIVFILGFLGRIVLHDYSNFETIMVASFLSAMLLPRKLTIAVTTAMIVASDFYLGYFGGSKIILFTYSGFLLVSLITRKLKHKIDGGFRPNTVYKFGGASIILTLVYDIWTNFGVFILTYNHTLENLILVYILGIPFMLYHLISSLTMFTLVGFPFYFIFSYGITDKLEIDKKDINYEQN